MQVFIFFLLASLSSFASVEPKNFDVKTEDYHQRIKPFIIPKDHPAKRALDEIFSTPGVLANEQTVLQAGFSILCYQSGASYIRLLYHPKLEGYLLKVYLDSEAHANQRIPGWKKFVLRCEGAKNIRAFIKNRNFKCFSVPDKFLYEVPISSSIQQPVVLVVTDMKAVSAPETEYAWKNRITKKHLDELCCILSYGYGSVFLTGNLPYTTSGKFACVDTEKPERNIDLRKVRHYFSEELKLYWDKISKKRK